MHVYLHHVCILLWVLTAWNSYLLTVCYGYCMQTRMFHELSLCYFKCMFMDWLYTTKLLMHACRCLYTYFSDVFLCLYDLQINYGNSYPRLWIYYISFEKFDNLLIFYYISYCREFLWIFNSKCYLNLWFFYAPICILM